MFFIIFGLDGPMAASDCDPPYSPGTTIVDFPEVCMSCLVKARLDITEITEIRLTNDSCLRVVSHPKMILLFTSTI